MSLKNAESERGKLLVCGPRESIPVLVRLGKEGDHRGRMVAMFLRNTTVGIFSTYQGRQIKSP